MGDLSAYKAVQSKTVEAIYAYHKKTGDAEPPRGYLGASNVGHECDRYLWYSFRWCVTRQFDGRMYRLFETGDLAEDRFAKELKAIGCNVKTRDDSGRQFEVAGVGGHLKGHMDGVALGVPEAPKTWHVCEFKTHNEKSFAELTKVGVKAAKPLHWAQMQVYMGLGDLDRALYLAVNKNDDSLYSERVEYDAKAFKAITARAERIIKAQQTPERVASRPDDFRCRFCEAADLCWGTGQVALPIPFVSCRTCCHATPVMDGDAGGWMCAKHGELQECTCTSHLVLPSLLSFCEVADAGDDWIEFRNTADGAVWRHGNAPGQWSTAELLKTPGPLVGAKAITRVKEKFDGAITGVEKTPLLDRYPPADCRLVWEGKNSDLAFSVEDHCTGLDCTAEFEDEAHLAFEYGGRFLAVTYKADNYAAIWEGKE